MVSQGTIRSLKEQKGTITGFDEVNKGNIFVDQILLYVQEKDRFKSHAFPVGQRIKFTQHKGTVYSIDADTDPAPPGAEQTIQGVGGQVQKATGFQKGKGEPASPVIQGDSHPGAIIIVGAYDSSKITSITMGCSIDVGQFSNIMHYVTGTDPEQVRRCLISELAKRASLNPPTRDMIYGHLKRTYLVEGEIK